MPSDSRFEILLRSPWSGPWRRFSDPVRVISARKASDIRAALGQVDDEVRGGHYAAGFVAYEAAAAFGLPVRPPDGRLPLLCFGIFAPDSVEGVSRLPPAGEALIGAWEPSIGHETYLQALRHIRERIEIGDTYQINFTFRLTAPFTGDPGAVMRDLTAAQAGPWSAFVDTGDHVICSASPELFFSLEDQRLVCRPMKGTWPRGYSPAQDAAHAEALRQSPKNRAENVMIVDMVRNDLGRVATTGSVRAVSLFDVERYPLQWQMTSTVEAAAPDATLHRLFEAMFPCGSITGAPKHSAMGIIRELESTPRGIYTGAIGYVSPRRRAHFSVAIRTVVLDRSAASAEFGVGSGVVWDSVDADEYEECLLKARMLGVSGPTTASYVIDPVHPFRLLETILWTPERGFALLDEHLRRIGSSAECFGFTCEPVEVRELVEAAVEDLRGPAKLRVLLEPDGSVLCEATDLSPLPDLIRLALAVDPVDRDSVFLYHKTTRREVYERARALRPDADAVVLWNRDGEVTEATESNMVIVREGIKVTPPVECGLLPGIMRAALLASGEIVEARITREDLREASEVWLINSVRGWMRATLAGPSA